MNDKKRSYIKLSKDEEAIFNKYFQEFLDAGFRSTQRKEIVDRTFNEILQTNPTIKRAQVHNKYNNLLSKSKEKDKQPESDNNQQKPKPLAQLPAQPLPSLLPQHQLQPSLGQQPNMMTNFIQQQNPPNPTVSLSQQQNELSQFPSRQDSLSGYQFGLPWESSGNNSQLPSRTNSTTMDFYFQVSNPDEFLNYSISPPSSSSSIQAVQSLDFTQVQQTPPHKIENCTKAKIYNILPTIQEDTDFTAPGCTYDLYQKIMDICTALYNSQFVFKYNEDYDNRGIIFYDKEKLDFLQKAEECFMNILDAFTTKLKLDFIFPQYSCCENVKLPIKNTFTKTNMMYNFSHPQETNRPFFKTSADIYRSQSEANNNEPVKKEPDQQKKEITSSLPFNVSRYSKLMSFRNLHLNEKLLSFFAGEFNEENCSSFQFESPEVATAVSYSLNLNDLSLEKSDQFLFCHPAFIYYCSERKSHILHFQGIECETGFFLPATSIYFYRKNGVNKIYACGDKRVKEYTISGLDDYIKRVYNGNTHPLEWSSEKDPDGQILHEMVKISNTCTYYIGEGNYESTVITVWKGQLVVGNNSSLYFWPIEGKQNSKVIDSKENVDVANKAGIDLSRVEWDRGKSRDSNEIEIKEMPLITSLSIIEKTESNSYLAVASNQYPVIYIFNEEKQIVSRLISHTMGVTCLNSNVFKLFSGSIDRTARIWNLNDDVTMTFFDAHEQTITAIETGFYFDQFILFTGLKDNLVQCWSVTNKKFLFDIQFPKDATPIKIVFMSGKNQVYGDFARLMIISEVFEQNMLKRYHTQFFEFI